MKRLLTSLLVLVLAVFSWGCSPTSPDQTTNPPPGNQINNGQQPDPTPVQPDPASLGQSRESLGGLRLGMSVAEVEKIAGTNFIARVEEEGGAFREGFTVRSYANGTDVVIGKTSGKVLQIDVFSANYPTAEGIKTGDSSIVALQKYRDKYPEFVGNQSPEILPGWYVTEPGVILVFSSMENRERSNRNLTPDSKIHAITLGYTKYFD